MPTCQLQAVWTWRSSWICLSTCSSACERGADNSSYQWRYESFYGAVYEWDLCRMRAAISPGWVKFSISHWVLIVQDYFPSGWKSFILFICSITIPGECLERVFPVLLQDGWILMNMPSTPASETPSLSLTSVSGLKTANLKCCKMAFFFLIHLHATCGPHASLTCLFPFSACELHETGTALPSAQTSTFP